MKFKYHKVMKKKKGSRRWLNYGTYENKSKALEGVRKAKRRFFNYDFKIRSLI